MRIPKLIPLIVAILPLHTSASQPLVPARVATVSVDPSAVTTLHLRPDFESAIHMPEEVTSVVLGSPGTFKAEHNEGEPEYVYVKPITKDPAQSNLLIATKSGLHVTLELISAGAKGTDADHPVDFLIEYRTSRGFLISSDAIGDRTSPSSNAKPAATPSQKAAPTSSVASSLEAEYEQQARINAPGWMKWEGKQIETSVGGIRQSSNQTIVPYSLLNASDHAVEVVPPQIQISDRKLKKKKKGNAITSEQLQVRQYRLSTTRLEAGARADGVLVFDRPNFKHSTEKLFLQIAQADQVDQPILIRLPFTPPFAGDTH